MDKLTVSAMYDESMERILEAEQNGEWKLIRTKTGKEYLKWYYHFGADGDRGEIACRGLLKANGFTIESDFSRHNEFSTDIYLILDGKRVNYEVKTGGGIIVKAKLLHKMKLDESDRIPENALLGVDFVVYCPYPKNIEWDDKDSVMDEFYVIPRTAFLDFLIATCGKRKHTFKTATKFSLNGTALNIQSTYLPQIAEGLLNSDFPTLREYLREIGRL